MEIRASVHSAGLAHRATVSTDGRTSALAIPAKSNGAGSSVNGGELLCLAIATCYCNDLHREATRFGVVLKTVDVEVVSEFGGPGEPARRIRYTARVDSDAPAAEIEALLRHTDAVAEVHNTLRTGLTIERDSAPSA